MKKTWLTSDTHLGHRRIAEYCGRPADHQERIIANWRRLLKPGDTLYHLGDFSFGDADAWLRNLPEGVEKILVEGNHDKRGRCFRAPWDRVVRLADQPLVVYHEGVLAHLRHHPPSDKPMYPDMVCFGHSHEKGVPLRWVGSQLHACLCVELWDYSPVSLDSLCEIYWAEEDDRWDRAPDTMNGSQL